MKVITEKNLSGYCQSCLSRKLTKERNRKKAEEKGKLTIESNIPEREFMESILNMYYSGCDVMFPLSLHALAHSWRFNKLNHYLKLLE